MAIALEQVLPPRPRFFYWMAVAFAVGVLWGFGPTYFLRPFIHTRDISWIVHIHALVYIGWIVLFIVQTTLVARHRTDLHRRLGAFGILWAVAVVTAGIVVVLAGLSPTKRDAWNAAHGMTASVLWLARNTTASDPMAFGLLFAAAIVLRRYVQAHKRLMLLAGLAIMFAALARAFDDLGWPIVLGPFGFESPNSPMLRLGTPLARYGFGNLVPLAPFFIALVAYDLVKLNRVHPATIAGGLVVFLLRPLAVWLG
jgi:hypothetical protein